MAKYSRKDIIGQVETIEGEPEEIMILIDYLDNKDDYEIEVVEDGYIIRKGTGQE